MNTQIPPQSTTSNQNRPLNRRTMMKGTLLTGLAAVLAHLGANNNSAFAATLDEPSTDETAFLAISQTITGHSSLDPILARRLFSAMELTFPDFKEKVRNLHTLLAPNQSPQDLLAHAGSHRDDLLLLNAAWYMGSTEDKTNAPMVAYMDALMYQPTQDALPVPTYCFNEPGWWTAAPPPLGVPTHAPLPKEPAAPVPVAVTAPQNLPQTPALKPIIPKSGPHIPLPHKER
ncbi:sugar dehydrogenase complex small subunit [Swingsia samuiensis]|uniref:Sorbitol dehydrogenase n=1 Tax=Swingsia samuiensis TaxID=1293412 RepID=A0A4Y6UI05_9PROT|nr:sugar dehydrogenase complex small subunit [Swingsia samuiensis]QDH17229.1 hypothetical protein E3D00_06400 [Swingsia samuiensis]